LPGFLSIPLSHPRTPTPNTSLALPVSLPAGGHCTLALLPSMGEAETHHIKLLRSVQKRRWVRWVVHWTVRHMWWDNDVGISSPCLAGPNAAAFQGSHRAQRLQHTQPNPAPHMTNSTNLAIHGLQQHNKRVKLHAQWAWNQVWDTAACHRSILLSSSAHTKNSMHPHLLCDFLDDHD
jgi:hypothetical protein